MIPIIAYGITLSIEGLFLFVNLVFLVFPEFVPEDEVRHHVADQGTILDFILSVGYLAGATFVFPLSSPLVPIVSTITIGRFLTAISLRDSLDG